MASAALFERLAHDHFGARAARFGSLWFGAGTATLLATSRLAGVSRSEFSAEVRGNARRLARALRSPLLQPEAAAAAGTGV